MDCDNHVFQSSFKAKCNTKQSNLLDLLQIKVQTETLEPETVADTVADTQPKVPTKGNDRFRFQKKTIKKVKTIGEIRREYETYVLSYLRTDLEVQKSKLYSIIRTDSLRSKHAIKLANKILDSDVPICKTTWDMITNLNPKRFPNEKQYVFYNGNKIRVRGSLGGRREMLFNYDLNNRSFFKTRKSTTKNIKKSIIFNSLSVNFKPGPLSKKTNLDKSYQRYNIGNTEVVELPQIRLEVKALYGGTIEPPISNYLHSLREENGLITQKWAEFAVSALGSVIDNKAVQQTHNPTVFVAKYKNDQNRILMRNNKITLNDSNNTSYTTPCKESISETVSSVVKELIDSVVIHFDQDKLYSKNDDDTISNENCKSKRNHELKKTNVSNMKLFVESNEIKCLEEEYCKLGCVCISLQQGYIEKDHCGRKKCMFKCICNDNELMNNLARGNTLNLDYYNKSNGKKCLRINKTDSINDSKLRERRDSFKLFVAKSKHLLNIQINLPNIHFFGIQPLCMVHGLYKCFCKNRFVHSGDGIRSNQVIEKSKPDDMLEDNIISKPPERTVEKQSYGMRKHIKTNNVANLMSINKTDIKSVRKDSIDSVIHNENFNRSYENNETYENPEEIHRNVVTSTQLPISGSCARTSIYKKKKFSIPYLERRNNKIYDLESKDLKLETRLKELIHRSTLNDNIKLNLQLQQDQEHCPVENNNFEYSLHKSYKDLNNRSNLKRLLERHYKKYRESIQNGTYNATIQPPIKGKFCLYPWEIILSRYKEKKNHFFVSKEIPFRMFITVSCENSIILEKCTNVNDIRISEIHKYPSTIRRLLTEEHIAKDYFCILYGMTNCWEIIGCVLKLNNNTITETEDNVKCKNIQLNDDVKSCNEEVDYKYLNEFENNIVEANEVDIDNEKKNIIKSEKKDSLHDNSITIVTNEEEETNNKHLAKLLNEKSVWPSLKHDLINNKAELYKNINMDNSTESEDEPTETKKCETPLVIDSDSISGQTANRNITNNMESVNTDKSNNCGNILLWFVMELEDKITLIRFLNKGYYIKGSTIRDNIKIARRTNKVIRMSTKSSQTKTLPIFGVYATPGIRKACILVGPYDKKTDLDIEIKKENFAISRFIKGVWLIMKNGLNEHILTNPLAFLEKNNIKITSSTCSHISVEVRSNNHPPKIGIPDKNNIASSLKPINVAKDKKISLADLRSKLKSELRFANNMKQDVQNKEKFLLNTSSIKVSEEIENENMAVIISDDDDDESSNNDVEDDLDCQKVFLECFNINNFGYITAKRNNKQELSFVFPGFKPSEFYAKDIVFSKLNEVIARKTFMPKNLQPLWHVVEDASDILHRQPLSDDEFKDGCVLTSQGLINRDDIIK